MTHKHTLWVARLHGDSQVRLSKRIVSLPHGIALNPDCDLAQPLPALASPRYAGPPVLYVHAGQPSRMYTKLFGVFRRVALTDTEGARIPTGTLQTAFARWIAQYTTMPAPETDHLTDAIELEMIYDSRTRDSTHSYRHVALHSQAWLYHAAQQEVTADGR